MLKPAAPITTARLVLRPYLERDLDDLHDIQSRPEVTRYLYWGVRSRDEVRQSLAKKIRDCALARQGDVLTLAVLVRDTGTVIGDVILIWTSAEHRQGEIGYVFHPAVAGKGYATEAAGEMLRLGFEDLGLHRIIGRLDGRNTSSARVLERLGMRREAHFVENEVVKGEWTDEIVYAITEDEWRAR